METVAISFGSIILLSIILYFVIKSAVRNGINESMLISDRKRKREEEKAEREIEDRYQKINNDSE
jgi:uncharacterized protein (UPF0218 family)